MAKKLPPKQVVGPVIRGPQLTPVGLRHPTGPILFRTIPAWIAPAPAAALPRSQPVGERTLTVARTGASLPLVYGRDVVGGKIYRAKFSGGKLIVVCVWGEGENDAVERVVDAGKTFNGTATHYTGTSGQTANALVASVWGQADTLTNVCYSVLSLAATDSLQLYAIIRGRKVYDPRTLTTVYSTNAALCLADFVDTQTEWNLNWASVGVAADYCDTIITGSIKRWEIGLTIKRGDVNAWIKKLKEYAHVFTYIQDGEMFFQPDEPRATDHVLTGSDIKNLQLRKLGQRDAPTQVIVDYTIPSGNEWRNVEEFTPDPAGSVPLRITRLKRPGYFHAVHANREAAETLNRANLQDLEATLELFDNGLKVVEGDVIDVTHPYGLTNKLFRVLKRDPLPRGRWRFNCIEYDPAIYSSAIVSDPTFTDTILPAPGDVPTLTNLVLTANYVELQPGTGFFKINATWDPTTYVYPHQYHVSLSDGAVVINTAVTSLEEYTSPLLEEGKTYTVTVTVVGYGGIESNPLSDTIQINSLDDMVLEFTTTGALETITIPCGDVGVFDASIDWGDGNTTTVTAYNSAGLAHEYATAGTYEVRIRGVFPNISFNYSGSYLELTAVKNFGNTGLIDMAFAFAGCENCLYFATFRTNTTKVVSMDNTFADCYLAVNIDVSGFDTSSCINMQGMFYYCELADGLDVSGFDTSKVTNMAFMFYGLQGLPGLDVSGFNTSNVTTMYGMFGELAVPSLDLRSFDTANVATMRSMFSLCSASTIDLSSFDTANVTNMVSMFFGCTATVLDVASWDVAKVTNMGSMFRDTIATTIDVSAWRPGAVTSFQAIFKNSLATSLDLSSWGTLVATAMDFMFDGMADLATLSVLNLDTSNATQIDATLRNCPSLTDARIDTWDISKAISFLAGGEFMLGTTFTTARYDATLIAWDALTPVSGKTWHFGGSQYTLGGAAATARANLISTDSWTIIDGGGV